MLKIKGRASRRFVPVIGEITFKERAFYNRSQAIIVTPKLGSNALGYKGCITTGAKGYFFHPDHVYAVTSVEQLHNGDIVCLDSDGSISVLWENESHQNVLFLTEACNCRCIMCPQPPRPHDPILIQQAHNVLDLLQNKPIKDICLTGGEPTLLGKDFIHILDRCVTEHPKAIISVLTNGKLFSNHEFTSKIAAVTSKNVIFCVSLHSEVDTIHDALVGEKGSYIATQQGIYNLATQGCHIEIRHVITRLNYTRLLSFAEHMYGYFPFCDHYALMGLELCGYAETNQERISINPNEYSLQLHDAVSYFHRRGLPISVYNVPLCMCTKAVKPFARRSISSWKNFYPPQCTPCDMKDSCAGFFSTSISLPLEHIQPLIKEE